MQVLHPRKRFFFLSVASFLIPLALFVLVLALKIHPAWSQAFHDYSFVTFLIVIALYIAAFRLPGRWNWLASISLTMLLFAISLSYQWTSGFSNNLVIGGLLPYKDSFSYYATGTQMLLNGQPIPAGGLQAAGRPLFPGLLASLLILTNQNLQWALAMLTGLTGLACYWATRQVYASLGWLAAAIYAALLYFYIQPLIGTTLSELPGLLFGCLGFLFLWKAAEGLQLRDLVWGIIILMLGVSIRAGAFFIFPGLTVWAGWAFRGEKHFSYRAALVAGLTALGAFVLINVLYPRLVVAPGAATFGNFAYALYGQVLGGAGWHRAIVDLQTHDPSVVYGAAFDFFTKHPISLFIGIAKSYRDFFLPGDAGIFSFYSPGGPSWVDVLLWLIGTILLARGAVRSIREIRAPLPSLFVAAWVGIFLSIPFLPPIDGGRRFYASTMPFFFAVVIFGLGRFLYKKEGLAQVISPLKGPLWAISATMLFITVFLPPVLRLTTHLPNTALPLCPEGEKPFIATIAPGSYINLIPSEMGDCGLAPNLCLDDFKANGAEKSVDDFYQKLISLTEADRTTLRVIPGINWVDQNAYYFVGDPRQLETSAHPVSGCAIETRTINQRIYKIQTVYHPLRNTNHKIPN